MNAYNWYVINNIKDARGTSREAPEYTAIKSSPSLQKQGLITKFIMFIRKGRNLLPFHKIIHCALKKQFVCMVYERSVLSIKCVFFAVTFILKLPSLR
jgi:hypothetical protein